MATRLTSLSDPLKREICSYLPARHLLRLASTCKAAERIVTRDEDVWRARAAALRIVLASGEGADPALRQIRSAMALDRRAGSGYARGVADGPAAFARVVNICIIFSAASGLFGHSVDQQIWNWRRSREGEGLESRLASLKDEYSRIQTANAQREQYLNENNRLWSVRDEVVAECNKLVREQDKGLSDLSQTLQQQLDDFPCTTNQTAYTDEAIRLGRIYLAALRAPRPCEYPAPPAPLLPSLLEYLSSVPVLDQMRDVERQLAVFKELGDLHGHSFWPYHIFLIGNLKSVNIMDAFAHGERRGWNYYTAAVGALSLGWGILFLYCELPVQGSSFAASGTVLLVRGLTSHNFVSRVCGEAQGRWNVVCIRTTARAKRLLHSPPCERISGRLSALKRSFTTKIGQAAGCVAGVARRVFQAFSFRDCG